MWPFSKKKSPAPPTITLRSALDQLAQLGIRMRPAISTDDLLHSTGGSLDSRIEPVHLLAILGGEVERGDFEPFSDDIWHLDAECIEDHGAYIDVANRFIRLAKGALPLENLKDFVDVENGVAWFEFTLDGQTTRWDLDVDNDWLDPQFYDHMQELAESRAPGKHFFICALGQDALVLFGTPEFAAAVGQFAGITFNRE